LAGSPALCGPQVGKLLKSIQGLCSPQHLRKGFHGLIRVLRAGTQHAKSDFAIESRAGCFDTPPPGYEASGRVCEPLADDQRHGVEKRAECFHLPRQTIQVVKVTLDFEAFQTRPDAGEINPRGPDFQFVAYKGSWIGSPDQPRPDSASNGAFPESRVASQVHGR
jgi:hypothetical protein